MEEALLSSPELREKALAEIVPMHLALDPVQVHPHSPPQTSANNQGGISLPPEWTPDADLALLTGIFRYGLRAHRKIWKDPQLLPAFEKYLRWGNFFKP